MKIKRKKQLNLPQLIEYAWENDIRNARYGSNYQPSNNTLDFDGYGHLVNALRIKPDALFTVEVEEEITLTTPLPSMLHVWKTEVLGTEMKEVKNKSIASQYTTCSTEFWLKEDNEMTLIWRNGEMVE